MDGSKYPIDEFCLFIQMMFWIYSLSFPFEITVYLLFGCFSIKIKYIVNIKNADADVYVCVRHPFSF